MAKAEDKPKDGATSHTAGGTEIFFLQDYKVKDDIGTEYTAGSKVSMNAASAEHFVRRGVACLSSDKAAIAEFNRRKQESGEDEE